MQVSFNQVQKSFNQQVVFRNISYLFQPGNAYAILGGNGSGKSTLLQLLIGNLAPTSGTIDYRHQDQVIEKQALIRNISYAAPYSDLIEEMTLDELLDFYRSFKTVKVSDAREFKALLNLENVEGKILSQFSSGMKQRVKLALATLTDSSILVLDEPVSNLDPAGIEWYGSLIEKHLDNRIVVVGSNYQEQEYFFCLHRIEIKQFK